MVIWGNTTTRNDLRGAGMAHGMFLVPSCTVVPCDTLKLKIMKKSLFIIAIAASLAATGCAGGYVDEQPADVDYDQGVAPGPGYIWIDGDWVWSGGRYV